MECLHCKGRMKSATAPFTIERKGYRVSWEAIPAWVCTQCGEPYFETPEVEQIQRALSVLDRESSVLTGEGAQYPARKRTCTLSPIPSPPNP